MKEYIQEKLKTFDNKFVASITSSPGDIEHARAVIFFEDELKIRSFIEKSLSEAYNRGVEDSLKCVPTKVVNGKLREEKWKHKFGQSEINAYNLHRKQTIDNISKLLTNK